MHPVTLLLKKILRALPEQMNLDGEIIRDEIKDAVRDLELGTYTLKVTPEFGRGLYASRVIQPGEVVTRCELLVFSADDTPKVNDTDLKYYTFKFNETQDCLCLGDGEIFNHQDVSNVSYQLEDFEGRKVMVFRAKEVIQAGLQLFINYTDDVAVNATEYVNKNMVG